MATTPYQPTLPEEVAFTDAEYAFMEEEPPGLFPQNQDSNFGWIARKVFTDVIQSMIDLQIHLYNERFPETSYEYLDEWEKMMGLPTSPSGVSLRQRRSDVLVRLDRGPFTNKKRRDIVEKYIFATFGAPILLLPEGVPLVAAGTPIYGEQSTNITDLYRIAQDVPGYYYVVEILSSITPAAGMERELRRITPAGIDFSIAFVASLSLEIYGAGGYGSAFYSK